MVNNIRPGPEPSSPSNLISMDGWTYFNADDGVHGRELWKTNGTVAGTQMIKDITPGPDGTSFGEVIIYDNLLFFTVNENDELWRTDGTEGTPGYKDGTYRIAKTAPDYTNSDIQDLTIHDGYLYFKAFDGGCRELWRTDGTAAGTQRLTYNPLLSYGTDPKNITSCDGRLFLAGHYASWTGRELLEYKINEELLVLIKNINQTGSVGSEPENLICFENKLFFSADDGNSGRALWVLTMPKQNSFLPGPLMLLLGDE
jgi:ELWxxDGT repeat protein